jgi:hypothetical protein
MPSEWHKCLRKRRHLDYWSAMQHANRLPDDGWLVIYPCEFCDGLHVGHLKHKPQTASELLKDLAKRIRRTNRRIARMQAERAATPKSEVEAIERYNQGLRTLRQNLRQLSEERTRIEQSGRLESDHPLAKSQ